MSVEIKRRNLLRATLAGGLALGLGQQAIAVVSGSARGQQPIQPDVADSDERAVLLRYGGELGGSKVGGRERF
ncbi:MAG: hypothetical protein JSR66_11680 [Proteobacteria bacterium]|nr:hypothetical protein [Pseudomonadota bacterium]